MQKLVPRSLIARIRESVIGDDAAIEGPFGAAPARLRRLHRLGSRARPSSRTSSASRCCRSTRTRTPSPRRRAARRRVLREDARRVIHRAVNGGRGRRRPLLRHGRRPARSTSSSSCSACGRRSSASRDAIRPARVPSSSSARTSTTPTSCRGASRSPTSSRSARTPTAASTSSTSSTSSARHADRPLKIGSFSAASNVTGIVTDVDARGDRCCTATARSRAATTPPPAPYLPIDMNASPETDGHLAYKDAVFVSPHKFVGGPGTPGVLVAKRVAVPRTAYRRCRAAARSSSSARRSQSYHPAAGDPRGGRDARDRGVDPRRPRLRAEGGGRHGRDPAPRGRRSRGARSSRGARTRSIEILGNPELDRLAIVSLGLRDPHGRLLHSHFVAALLNDLFGIQARSGCFCAGPYVHRLYPIDDDWSARMDAQATAGTPRREALVPRV